eukprot:CAMPEP_0181231484 /NCGR_PEP_ID=MMETSP1096-20121128/35132_1 /TAXON_ID=156174 ORGANISM="Chrysochromulina ericina, Strain CCMP281" /NCGR_SAMPLE_ID=MMETSP1096 /ASSEMBLY_ACC=CAM_ASM_000453 /LENGTH=90 /DNA_ID=CAMNT_0023325531 /DNA_START=131 /DNA_END=403 /DNA_ORIENTATION=+
MSERCVLRLVHIESSQSRLRDLFMSNGEAVAQVKLERQHQPGGRQHQPGVSKFKVLSVIVPPFDMNRRSITDLKNGELYSTSVAAENSRT